eukprot:6475208-Amphidinium_carterae.2
MKPKTRTLIIATVVSEMQGCTLPNVVLLLTVVDVVTLAWRCGVEERGGVGDLPPGQFKVMTGAGPWPPS